MRASASHRRVMTNSKRTVEDETKEWMAGSIAPDVETILIWYGGILLRLFAL